MLQLCRAEISNTEWFAANLINDPNYTPKPITEIFTTDITFIPRKTSTSTPAISRETPSPTISTTFSGREMVTQDMGTERIPQGVNPTIQQSQGNMPPNNNMPSAVLVYDPSLQNSQIYQQPSSTPATAEPELSSTLVTQMSPMPPSPPSPPNLIPATQGPTIVVRQPLNQNVNPPLIPIGLIPNVQNGNSAIPMSNIPVVNTSSGLIPPSRVIPDQQSVTVRPENRRPSLTVRVKTPRGSITNIRINPSSTVRPSTTRRRKSSKRNQANDYEICLNSCSGRKEPICSSPIGVFPIDPDRLKGFASLCHMACHNSFRKDRKY